MSKWKDRREVLCITMKYHPKLIPVKNRIGQEKIKPRRSGNVTIICPELIVIRSVIIIHLVKAVDGTKR